MENSFEWRHDRRIAYLTTYQSPNLLKNLSSFTWTNVLTLNILLRHRKMNDIFRLQFIISAWTSLWIFSLLRRSPSCVLLWEPEACSLVQTAWCFRVAYCFHHQGDLTSQKAAIFRTYVLDTASSEQKNNMSKNTWNKIRKTVRKNIAEGKNKKRTSKR